MMPCVQLNQGSKVYMFSRQALSMYRLGRMKWHSTTHVLPSQCQPVLGVPAVVHLHKRFMNSRSHPIVDRILRVDHAGKFGANKIYAGHAAVLGVSNVEEPVQVVADFAFSFSIIINIYLSMSYWENDFR